MHQAEERVAAVAAGVAVGSAADLALGDKGADVALGAIGVQRDIGPIEHLQQFRLVGMQPCQQAIEDDESGAATEDAIDPDAQRAAALAACA
jgi:hypothetical protein